LLELSALAAMGYWGWLQSDSWLRIVLALGIPTIAAVLWGTFRVPNDPGRVPVPIPGVIRLALELLFFGFAVWALNDSVATNLSWIMGVTLFIHYAVSYDRVIWLITSKEIAKKESA
jgi:hypothetical protein